MKRTVKGKAIDMQQLAFEQKNTIAVGNMNVNANGDQIDNHGNIVKKREEVVKFHYKTEKTTSLATSLKDDIKKDELKLQKDTTKVVKKPKTEEEIQDNGDIVVKDKQ
jgi:hypothetical protein